MNFPQKIVSRLRKYAARFYRPKINQAMRQRLRNSNPTIISSNCIGGILSHDLSLQFRSPTINLFFEAEDFVKFAENMPYYLSLPLTDFNVEEKPYPIGRLGDISLYFVHYPDIESCKTQWRRRASRVDYNNLFLVMTDRNGCTDELVERFSKVPYPKVLFSSKEMPEYDFAVYVPGFSKDGQVGELNRYADFHGNRYYELYFDFVSFLNGDR